MSRDVHLRGAGAWPAPCQPMAERDLIALIDEYERRALAIGQPFGAYQRRAFRTYRTIAAQLRGWLAGARRRREALRVPPPVVPLSPLRGALDMLCGSRRHVDAASRNGLPSANVDGTAVGVPEGSRDGPRTGSGPSEPLRRAATRL